MKSCATDIICIGCVITCTCWLHAWLMTVWCACVFVITCMHSYYLNVHCALQFTVRIYMFLIFVLHMCTYTFVIVACKVYMYETTTECKQSNTIKILLRLPHLIPPTPHLTINLELLSNYGITMISLLCNYNLASKMKSRSCFSAPSMTQNDKPAIKL